MRRFLVICFCIDDLDMRGTVTGGNGIFQHVAKNLPKARTVQPTVQIEFVGDLPQL